MKPFDLERALAGDPVVTRWGEEATQFHLFEGAHRPLACVIGGNVCAYFGNGVDLESGMSSKYDLFMAPKKRIVWVNLYYWEAGQLAFWYDTQEEADAAAISDRIGGRAWPIEIEE